MTISTHQRKVLTEMSKGKPLFMCIVQIKTKLILERKGLIENNELTDEGLKYVQRLNKVEQ